MQDLQATIQMVLDYVKGIWIKKRFIIISSWLIAPIGFLLVANMPDVYESEAKVYADTSSILKPLLKGLAVQDDPAVEIKLMAKTLLSRPNLEDIARETDLDIQANTAEEFEAIVDSLEERISLKPSGRENIYTITFNDKDPQLTKRVVSVTLDKFVESSLGENRKDSDTASRFLEEQINEYATRLEAAEQRLANFKKQYGDLIIINEGGYYQEVSSLKEAIEKIDLETQEKQTQLESLQSKFTSTTSIETQAENPNIASQYDDRISQLQESLDELQIRFTDKHPDVVQTQEKLARLENLRKEEIAEIMAGIADGQIASGGLSDNAIVQDLTIVINTLEGEIASLEVRKTNFKNKLEDYEQKLDLIPDIEAKQTALNRDYGITKQKYEELLARKESADISRKADISVEEVKFRIIEPPSVPLKPSGPNRLIFYTLVLIVSFLSGTGVAFLVSQLNPVVINANSLNKISNRPVLGVVSDIHLDDILKRDKKRLYVFLASSIMIFGLFMVFVVSEIVLKTTPIKIVEGMIL